MKKIALIASMVFALVACGGAGVPSFLGPVLDISEIGVLRIDQFYTAAGLEDEYADMGEFAVYLRDAVTGQDLACAGQDEGMDQLGNVDTYYGGLDIPLKEVQGEHPNSSARFILVFVEKDSADCPKPIASGDDIIGMSPEFSAEDLIDGRIWTSNGLATLVFRLVGTSSEDPSAMAAAMQDGLIIDQVSFENGDEGKQEHTYYLFAERYENGEAVEMCQIDDDDFANVRYGNMTYAALNLALPCFTPDLADFASIRVKLSLWIQRSSGPALVGETEVKTIGDMIGEQLLFTNDRGFIRIRNVATTPFSVRDARLEELTKLMLTALDYTGAPAVDEQVEVHLRSPAGYSVACADTALATPFVAMEEQRELFGWEKLDLVVLGRSDGNACPKAISGEFSVLGEASGLEPFELALGSAAFTDGGGASWIYQQ